MKTEFVGFDTLGHIKEVLTRYNAERIFLVTGKTSFSSTGAKEKLRSVFENKSVTIFNEFSPNPDVSEVCNGIKNYNKCDPDIVIAVGGGSVIDIGKIVNLFANNPHEPYEYIKKTHKPTIRGKPFIAVPTTSGTGSECTHFATVYIDKDKFSVTDKDLLVPTISIVDPSLTLSMSPYLTASTGLDALCQGIESFWSVHSTEESRSYAKEAISLAIGSLERAVNKSDKLSRFNMAKAAHLSGKAINISKTTAAHSISYPITAHFGVAHGHAVALSMGVLIDFNAHVSSIDCNDDRGVGFVKDRIDEIIDLLGCRDASDAKVFFQRLMRNINIESRLHKLGIDDVGRRLLVEKGFTPERMDNNPRLVSKQDLTDMLDEIK